MADDVPDPSVTDGQGPQPRRTWAARPRFARFVAALQSPGSALRPAPALAGAEPWAVVEPRATLIEAGGRQPMLGGRGSLAAMERRLRRPAVRRSALLIGAASAAALALVALFEPTNSQDQTQLARPPAEIGGLVRAPATPDRYRLAAGRPDPGVPRPMLVANRTPSIEVGHGLPETTAPPPDPVPASAGIARLSAVVRPAPPRIEDTVASLAADGKFAALAVQTGALARPAIDDDDPLYDLGQRLQRKGEVAQAIEAYRMAAEANPRHAATYYDWGYLLQQQGDEDGARQKYLTTLQFAPRHAFAHYNLGYILQKRGDYPNAIIHYQAAIAADPSFFWSYYNLGYIEQKLGHYREALADYRESIAIDPKHALAYENIATILRYHSTD